MKQTILFTLVAILGVMNAKAQDIVQVSVGANYAKQVYYQLSDDQTFVLNNNSWDLAFAQTGSIEAGIHVNESVTISFTGPAPATLLFMAPTNNFEDVIEMDMIGDSLYNDELSWGNGALNVPRDTNDWADFGWGSYNAINHAIEGNQVYVIQLRDNSYRKFMIQSLISGVYTMKYAALDGSNEQVVTIDKAAYPDNKLILFSFLEGKVLDELPVSYDLIFQRYSELDPSNVGVMVEYTVTGILTAPGVLSAQANGIGDPEDVDPALYVDSLDQQLNIIGQDWKFFSFETGWNIVDNVCYFVKTTEDRLWQLYMYDFEGSSTGTYTLAKWDHGILAGVEDPLSPFESVTVVPNPVSSHEAFSLVLEAKTAAPAHIVLVNQLGQVIREYKRDVQSGLNAFEMDIPGLTSGQYILQVESGDSRVVRKVSIK